MCDVCVYEVYEGYLCAKTGRTKLCIAGCITMLKLCYHLHYFVWAEETLDGDNCLDFDADN